MFMAECFFFIGADINDGKQLLNVITPNMINGLYFLCFITPLNVTSQAMQPSEVWLHG